MRFLNLLEACGKSEEVQERLTTRSQQGRGGVGALFREEGKALPSKGGHEERLRLSQRD